MKIAEDKYNKVSEILKENDSFCRFFPEKFISSLLKKDQDIYEVSPVFWEIIKNNDFVNIINFFSKSAGKEVIGEKKKILINSKKEQDISGVISELEIYYLLSKKGIMINFIKSKKNEKTPDFIIKINEYNIYLEVFTIQSSEDEFSFEENITELGDMINKIEDNPFQIVCEFKVPIKENQLVSIVSFIEREIKRSQKKPRKNFKKLYKIKEQEIVNVRFTFSGKEKGFFGGCLKVFPKKIKIDNKIIKKIIEKINSWQFPKRDDENTYFGFLVVIKDDLLNIEYDISDAFLGKRSMNKYDGLLDINDFNNSDLDFLIATEYKTLLSKDKTFLYIPKKAKTIKEDILEKIFLIN